MLGLIKYFCLRMLVLFWFICAGMLVAVLWGQSQPYPVMVYNARSDGDLYAIRLLDLNTAQTFDLMQAPQIKNFSLSPDRRRIAYQQVALPIDSIYVAEVGRPQSAVHLNAGYAPQWQPDSRGINYYDPLTHPHGLYLHDMQGESAFVSSSFFIRMDETYAFQVRHASEGIQARLGGLNRVDILDYQSSRVVQTFYWDNLSDLAWHPAQPVIAIEYQARLYLLNTATSESWPLSNVAPFAPGIVETGPLWSVDGRFLAYKCQIAGEWHICLVDHHGEFIHATAAPGMTSSALQWWARQ